MKLFPYFLMYIGIGTQSAYYSLKKKGSLFKVLLFIFIFGNLAYFEYAALIDKRGAMDSMNYLRSYPKPIQHLLLLTECHRTPYYSYLHKNIPISFPECSPYEENPINDSKLLFVNPEYFIYNSLLKYKPSHILIYNSLLQDEKVQRLLKKNSYKEIQTFFNSLYVDTPIGYETWHELILFEKN